MIPPPIGGYSPSSSILLTFSVVKPYWTGAFGLDCNRGDVSELVRLEVSWRWKFLCGAQNIQPCVPGSIQTINYRQRATRSDQLLQPALTGTALADQEELFTPPVLPQSPHLEAVPRSALPDEGKNCKKWGQFLTRTGSAWLELTDWYVTSLIASLDSFIFTYFYHYYYH